MIKEKGVDSCLKKIDEVIMPANVCELVCDHRFELRGRKARERTCRKQDHWTKPADNHRTTDDRRLDDADRTRHAKPVRHDFRAGEPHL